MFEKGLGLKGRGNSGIYQGKNMTHQQAIEYFFNRIRGQILTALANRKMCEDLYLMGKLEIFEKDRKEAIGKDSCDDLPILKQTVRLNRS